MKNSCAGTQTPADAKRQHQRAEYDTFCHVLIFTDTALPALLRTILTALALTQPDILAVTLFFRFARFRFFAIGQILFIPVTEIVVLFVVAHADQFRIPALWLPS